MITIAESVSEIIRRKPFLESAMADGLINLSSLARQMKPEIENRLKKEIQMGAIVMALKRLPVSPDKIIGSKVKRVMKSLGDIIVRSNLIDYTYRNTPELIVKQQELLGIARTKTEFFCTFSQGVYETAMVLSDSIETVMDELFAEEELISKTDRLSSVTLKLPTENTEVPGIYFYIFKILAWEGINIREVISTSHEFTIIVKDVDVNKAFSVLMDLKRGKS